MFTPSASPTDLIREVRVGPEPVGPQRPARRFPDGVRVLFAALAMILMALAPALVVLIPGVKGLLESSSDVTAGLVMAGMSAISLLTAVLLVWLLMTFVDRRPLRETGWRWNARSLPMLLLGTAIAAGLVVLGSLGVHAAGLDRTGELPNAPWWLIVVVALAQAFLLQGIPEELIWRGYVLQTLRIKPQTAVIVSALGFGVMHLASQGGQQNALERVLYLIPPTGFALLAGALVLTTGSLWAACGIHGGFHVGTLIAAFLGAGEGPATWVTLGVLHAIVAVILLRQHSAKGRAGTPATTDDPAAATT